MYRGIRLKIFAYNRVKNSETGTIENSRGEFWLKSDFRCCLQVPEIKRIVLNLEEKNKRKKQKNKKKIKER